MFSYGSGLASSMFSLTIKSAPTEMREVLNVSERLEARTCITPEAYDAIMHLREKAHNCKDYVPVSTDDGLFEGSYYLVGVDDKFRRTYAEYGV